MNASIAFIYTTMPSRESAEALALQAIETNHAACVNIIPDVVSVYQWQGKTEHASEVIMFFKTALGATQALMAWIKHHHPYEVPAIWHMEVPVLPDYFSYIQEHTAHLRHDGS